MATLYEYVGPADIRDAVAGDTSGVSIDSSDELGVWSSQQDEWHDDVLIVTFVILPDGTLRVAPRRTEHVACALGGSVLAAGELTICSSPRLAVGSPHHTSHRLPRRAHSQLHLSVLPRLWGTKPGQRQLVRLRFVRP